MICLGKKVIFAWLIGFFLVVPAVARAAADVVTENNIPFGTTLCGDPTRDQPSCIGMCACQIKVTLPGVTLPKNYKWAEADPTPSELLFSVTGDHAMILSDPFAYEVYYQFTTDKCAVTVLPSVKLTGDSSGIAQQELNPFTCTYSEPFCCCEKTADGKYYGNCQRYTDHTDPFNSSYSPTCARLGATFSPVRDPKKGAGCMAFEGAAVSPSSPSKPAATTPDSSSAAGSGTNAPFVSNLKPCPDGRGTCTLIVNPLESRGTDIFKQVGGLVGYILLLIGSITLLMVVWGAFQWLTAAGNAEKIEQGSKTMVWAMIGVFAVFISYFLLSTYIDYLTGVK